MFGIDRFAAPSTVGAKFLAVFRQLFGGYQPSRTYMRGEGPACQRLASRNNGIDDGSLT